MSNLQSELSFAKQGSKQAQPTLQHAKIFATSKTYGWDGIYAEVGENQGWHVEDMVPVGHYIAISRDTEDFHFKVKDAAGIWQPVVMKPGTLWIQPANQPFSFDVQTMARWCGVIVQPAKLKALVGSESAVEPVIGLFDEVLTPVMQAICAEVLRGGSSGRKFAEAMTLVIGTQLLRLFGEANAAPKGGITGRQLRLVADHVDQRIDRDISVEKLAQLVGLSEAHFARAFKQTTGVSPHKYVTERRLERGKRLLADTQDSIAQIALDCGFADQAHFARSFAQHYGSSPSALRKSFG
ncbi:MAG: AraC family transcriptional regulator [Burkholderiales bacterium]|nr:MAG: AraC family transcriptional regulator [Burkholderiales bacterium]